MFYVILTKFGDFLKPFRHFIAQTQSRRGLSLEQYLPKLCFKFI